LIEGLGEIGFRLEKEREEEKGKSRKKYLIFYLETKIRSINFVVPKANRKFFEIMK